MPHSGLMRPRTVAGGAPDWVLTVNLPAKITRDRLMQQTRSFKAPQRIGLRLADIRDLLAVRDTGTCPCESAEPLLRRRLAEPDAEMTRLAALPAEMVMTIDALPAAPDCPGPAPGRWCPPEERRWPS
jgi:MerR, DNA binding